jgi:CCR4-NOT transcription complex subunit 1
MSCSAGRYLFFNAIANQLRYPNSHTHYFSCLLLYLFLEANSRVIQEHFTRSVCLDLFDKGIGDIDSEGDARTYGLRLTHNYVDLQYSARASGGTSTASVGSVESSMEHGEYGFWKHEFTRCAPEIERLFQSVAMSCMGRPGGSSEASPAAATTNQS